MDTVWVAFLTGLTTGGLSCIAVQGGLLTSALASNEYKSIQSPSLSTFRTHWQFISVFLIVKVIAHSLFGAVLGALGGIIGFSLYTQGMLQIGIGLFMFATVARMLNLHPIFRYAVIAPPKPVYRFLRTYIKQDHWVTPAVLGVFSLLLPCGVTQMMMAGSIATGDAVMGALLLGAFTLGTSPIFFLLGMTTGQLLSRPIFSYVAVALIAYFGITSINGGMTLIGSPYTIKNFYLAATMSSQQPAGKKATVVDGSQQVEMIVSSYAYEPNVQALKVGVPVTLRLKTENAQGCIRAFTIPSLNISKILPESGEEVVQFTPTKPGKLSFSCNMGMYGGEFDVTM